MALVILHRSDHLHALHTGLHSKFPLVGECAHGQGTKNSVDNTYLPEVPKRRAALRCVPRTS